MKILTVVGARPQFVKAAPVGCALRAAGHTEFLVHTGQHYDDRMSAVFFRELEIPAPDMNLEVGSGMHGQQTGRMLMALEEAMQTQQPDCVLVYGDTNSTLAGALAACKLRIPLAHVEAGLRSYNREMPEEHNRVLTDHCSDLLLCPTERAVQNLAHEGITQGVHHVGDVMYDAVLQFAALAQQKSTILEQLELERDHYVLATIHRPYNTDMPRNLLGIIEGLSALGEKVVFPIHPRTRKKLSELGDVSHLFNGHGPLRLIEPVGYLDMLALEQHSRLIVTDSGGVQKESYFFRKPCVTLRPETEWVETVETGWNTLCEVTSQAIAQAVAAAHGKPRSEIKCYGDGSAARRIVEVLQQP